MCSRKSTSQASGQHITRHYPPTDPMAGRVVKDPQRYKTILCNKFEKLGKCPYGPRCQFAHGKAELRRRPPLAPKTSNVDECSESSQSAPTSPRLLPQASSLVLNQMEKDFSSCEQCECTTPTDPEPLMLGLHELTGQVLCRRDASHTTQNVRRAISFLFEDSENDPALSSWGGKPTGNTKDPFGYDWVARPIDMPSAL